MLHVCGCAGGAVPGPAATGRHRALGVPMMARLTQHAQINEHRFLKFCFNTSSQGSRALSLKFQNITEQSSSPTSPRSELGWRAFNCLCKKPLQISKSCFVAQVWGPQQQGLGSRARAGGQAEETGWVPGAGLKLPERCHSMTRAVGRGWKQDAAGLCFGKSQQ